MYLGLTQAEAENTDWRGYDEGGKLKQEDVSTWQTPNIGATNLSGFTALPSGYKWQSDGAYYGINQKAYIWTSSSYPNIYDSWRRHLRFDKSEINRLMAHRRNGFTVRCLRD